MIFCDRGASIAAASARAPIRKTPSRKTYIVACSLDQLQDWVSLIARRWGATGPGYKRHGVLNCGARFRPKWDGVPDAVVVRMRRNGTEHAVSGSRTDGDGVLQAGSACAALRWVIPNQVELYRGIACAACTESGIREVPREPVGVAAAARRRHRCGAD